MGRPPNIKKVETPESYRIKIMWKNIHTGTGIKLLRTNVVEVDQPMYEALCDISRINNDGDEIDAIKLVSEKTALTHKFITVNKVVDGKVLLIPALEAIN